MNNCFLQVSEDMVYLRYRGPVWRLRDIAGSSWIWKENDRKNIICYNIIYYNVIECVVAKYLRRKMASVLSSSMPLFGLSSDTLSGGRNAQDTIRFAVGCHCLRLEDMPSKCHTGVRLSTQTEFTQ